MQQHIKKNLKKNCNFPEVILIFIKCLLNVRSYLFNPQINPVKVGLYYFHFHFAYKETEAEILFVVPLQANCHFNLFFFPFYGHTQGVWKFLGQGLNRSSLSCSCQPVPQPQQRGIGSKPHLEAILQLVATQDP